MIERVDCDLDFATPAAKWIEQVVRTLAPGERGTVIAVDFGAKPAAVAEAGPVEAEITEHMGIIDPTKVVRAALQDAASIRIVRDGAFG